MAQVISNYQQIERLPDFVDLEPAVTAHGTMRLVRERGPLAERIGIIRTVLEGKPVTKVQFLGVHVLNDIDGYVQTGSVTFGGRTTRFYGYSCSGSNPAIFLFQNTGNTVYIARSANGTGAWTDVLTYTGVSPDALPNIMADCGNDRMVLVEYGNTVSGRIWASVDNGQNWGNNSPAFDNGDPIINADWIKHYHGVVYDSVTDSLVIMHGDSNDEARLLYCDDIDDLFANPATWKTRWGLDTNVQQVNRNYALNDNLVNGLPSDQSYRAVSADFTTVGGRRYIVWSEDAASPGGQNIWAQDITDGPLEDKVRIGDQIGANWIVKTLSNGTVVVAANSESSGGSPLPGHDTYLRLYAVRPDLSGADVIHQCQRTDFASPSGSAVWWTLTEVYGRMFAHTTYAAAAEQDEKNKVLGMVGGAGDLFLAQENFTPAQLQVVAAPMDKRNLIANGRFMVDTDGWTTLTNATVARDTVNKPTNETASLAITPSAAATAASVRFDFSELQRLHWGGQLWTIRFLYRIDGVLGTQNPGFFVQYGNSQSKLSNFSSTSGAWVEYVLTEPIPKNCSSLQVWWYATRTGAEAGVNLNIADVSINLGTTINNRGVTP